MNWSNDDMDEFEDWYKSHHPIGDEITRTWLEKCCIERKEAKEIQKEYPSIKKGEIRFFRYAFNQLVKGLFDLFNR